MSCILSVYSINALKDFLLPAIDNADSSIIVNSSVFSLSEDVVIPLEVIDGQWYIREMNLTIAYTTLQERYSGQPLKDRDLLMLTLPEGQVINIIVREVKDSFVVYTKYDVREIDSITIGRNHDCDIRYDFLNLISKAHGVIRKEGSLYVVEDTGSNGIFINNMRMAGRWQLSFGDRIDVFGLRMVFLGNALAVNVGVNGATVREGALPLFRAGDATEETERTTEPIVFHRSPRKLYRLENDTVEIEAPPLPDSDGKQTVSAVLVPSLTMVLTMILGCGFIIYSAQTGGGYSGMLLRIGLAVSIGSALIGMVWSLANIRYNHKRSREKEQRRVELYGEYLVKCAELIKGKYDKNMAVLREMYPISTDCCRYTENSVQLWSRNTGHEDMLFVRLGLGDIPFQVTINIPYQKIAMMNDSLAEKPEMIRERFKTLHEVPVGVDLLKHRLVGVFGGENKQGAIKVLYNIVAQIAANNCYTDVKLVFVYDEKKYDDSGTWCFAKWFPHVWSEDKKTRYVAKDKFEAADIFYELTKVFRIRQNEKSESGKNGSRLPKPYYIMVIADSELLEGELISKYIFEPKEEYGLTTILLEENYEHLPNVCDYLIQNNAEFTGIYSIEGNNSEKLPVEFDAIAGITLEEFGRRLSNIEVNEIETGGEVPNFLTFFEMYGVNSLDELNVIDRWRKNRTYDSMKALIGHKAGGAPCYLDLHEKYHGPHGLMAGTTGSGKSELLQTYMLSMAINYSPDDIGFFVIDYKGGGMANLLSGLPHMIGHISNLSGSQVRRAMVSIKSENKRRQRIFNEYGVNNINLYTKLYKNNEAKLPLPHIFIIIDEFAELKREEPEFMGELISVAQVGRSLGIHLILATQKPGGMVDDNIRSNSKFRLCLRVQDGQDSEEVLHKPDAAYITQAGRCYLQVGNDELYELFQTGYSGAVYDKDGALAQTDVARMISDTGKTALIGKRAWVRPSDMRVAGMRENTQLNAVVEYLDRTAKEHGYNRKLRLWLPVLPARLYLDELADGGQPVYDGHGWKQKEEQCGLSVYMGLCDDPVNQEQMPFVMDLSANGHYAVCGTVVSGKSTFLQTFVYAMICKYTPEEVNIYCIDYGSRMLSAFGQAPHVGGLIYENEQDRLSKFITMLTGILEERKELFRGGNYSQYVQISGITVPAIVVVIDNFAGFRSKTDNRYDDFFVRLSKDGPGCGVYIVLTAAGLGTLELPSRIGDNFRAIVSLEMGDKYQYADVMRTVHIEVFPEKDVKGRGLVRIGDSILEFQTALAFRAEDDFKRSEAIEKLAENMKNIWNGKAARRIPEIPRNFIWSEFVSADQVQNLCKDKGYLPVGYDAESVEVYGVDLSRTYCYLLGGRARTGKTNMLKVMLCSAAFKTTRIAVVDFEGELTPICDKLDVTYIADDETLYGYLKDELIPAYRERNERMRTLALKELKDETPIFVFIADLPEFIRHIYLPSEGIGGMEAVVENFWDKGRGHGIFWVGCMNTEDANLVADRKAYKLFVSDKRGVYFGGNVSAQKIFNFDDMPYAEQLKPEKPGVAILPLTEEETVRKVAVPLCE